MSPISVFCTLMTICLLPMCTFMGTPSNVCIFMCVFLCVLCSAPHVYALALEALELAPGLSFCNMVSTANTCSLSFPSLSLAPLCEECLSLKFTPSVFLATYFASFHLCICVFVRRCSGHPACLSAADPLLSFFSHSLSLLVRMLFSGQATSSVFLVRT